MKNRAPLIIVAALAVSLASCSKHTSVAPKVTDLGVVEVSDGATNRVAAADGSVFLVRSFILKDQKGTVNGKEMILKGQTIVLIINKEERDSSGVTRLSPDETIGATPGQTVGISDGVTSISITPKIKP